MCRSGTEHRRRTPRCRQEVGSSDARTASPESPRAIEDGWPCCSGPKGSAPRPTAANAGAALPPCNVELRKRGAAAAPLPAPLPAQRARRSLVPAAPRAFLRRSKISENAAIPQPALARLPGGASLQIQKFPRSGRLPPGPPGHLPRRPRAHSGAIGSSASRRAAADEAAAQAGVSSRLPQQSALLSDSNALLRAAPRGGRPRRYGISPQLR